MASVRIIDIKIDRNRREAFLRTGLRYAYPFTLSTANWQRAWDLSPKLKAQDTKLNSQRHDAREQEYAEAEREENRKKRAEQAMYARQSKQPLVQCSACGSFVRAQLQAA